MKDKNIIDARMSHIHNYIQQENGDRLMIVKIIIDANMSHIHNMFNRKQDRVMNLKTSLMQRC